MFDSASRCAVREDRILRRVPTVKAPDPVVEAAVGLWRRGSPRALSDVSIIRPFASTAFDASSQV